MATVSDRVTACGRRDSESVRAVLAMPRAHRSHNARRAGERREEI